MRLLITRPAEDAEPLVALLGERGIETVVEPLISVTDLEGPAPDLTTDLVDIQALLITSANGIRAFARRRQDRRLAVYAVGDASARTARALGFGNVFSATGDVAALVVLVRAELDPDGGALLHVAGTHVAGDLSGELEQVGFRVRREVLYQARAADAFGPDALQALKDGTLDGVLLFSRRTADLFTGLITGAGLSQACERLSVYCLSPAVADVARGLPWRRVVVAPKPNQDALLKAIETGG
jgi:uroporphyrinogen-III synthase